MAPAAWRRNSGCLSPRQLLHKCLKTQRGINTMKRIGLTIFAAAVLALPLCAQTVTTALRAEIPFEFAVGNTTVPAGEYVVAFRSGSPIIQLKGSKSYLLATNPDQSAAS